MFMLVLVWSVDEQYMVSIDVCFSWAMKAQVVKESTEVLVEL